MAIKRIDHEERQHEQGADSWIPISDCSCLARKRIGHARVRRDGPFEKARVELPQDGLGRY